MDDDVTGVDQHPVRLAAAFGDACRPGPTRFETLQQMLAPWLRDAGGSCPVAITMVSARLVFPVRSMVTGSIALSSDKDDVDELGDIGVGCDGNRIGTYDDAPSVCPSCANMLISGLFPVGHSRRLRIAVLEMRCRRRRKYTQAGGAVWMRCLASRTSIRQSA